MRTGDFGILDPTARDHVAPPIATCICGIRLGSPAVVIADTHPDDLVAKGGGAASPSTVISPSPPTGAAGRWTRFGILETKSANGNGLCRPDLCEAFDSTGKALLQILHRHDRHACNSTTPSSALRKFRRVFLTPPRDPEGAGFFAALPGRHSGGAFAVAHKPSPLRSRRVEKKIHKAQASPATAPAVEVLTACASWDFRISELSGLRLGCADEQLFYVVSDLGHIIHFRTEVSPITLSPVWSRFYGPLDAQRHEEKFFNTEDLVALNGANGKPGDSEIAVAFEDGPRGALHLDRAVLIETIPLAGAPWLDRDNYRQVNQRLESLALTPTRLHLRAADAVWWV